MRETVVAGLGLKLPFLKHDSPIGWKSLLTDTSKSATQVQAPKGQMVKSPWARWSSPQGPDGQVTKGQIIIIMTTYEDEEEWLKLYMSFFLL